MKKNPKMKFGFLLFLTACKLPDPVAETGDLSDYLDSLNESTSNINIFKDVTITVTTKEEESTPTDPGSDEESTSSSTSASSDTSTSTSTSSSSSGSTEDTGIGTLAILKDPNTLKIVHGFQASRNNLPLLCRKSFQEPDMDKPECRPGQWIGRPLGRNLGTHNPDHTR